MFILNGNWVKSRFVANSIKFMFISSNFSHPVFLSGFTVLDMPPAKRNLDLSKFSVKHVELQREQYCHVFLFSFDDI